MKCRHLAAWFASAVVLSAPIWADELQRYAWAWPLSLEGDSAAWQVELPVDVYRSVNDRALRDLVVVDAAGNAVPTAARAVDAATTVSARSELPLFALPAGTSTSTSEGPLNLRIERDADGRLRSLGADLGAADAKPANAAEDWLVDASRLDAPIDSLRLDWDDAGAVNAQFALSASDDLQTWRNVVANASVLSLAQGGNRLDRHDIAAAGTRAKYLRLRRLDRGAALTGLHISAATSSIRSPARAAREWLDVPAQGSAAGTTTAAGGSEYHYALPAALPAEAIRLDLGADNSVARVVLASRRNDTDAWTARAEFTAFRLQQGGETIVNDEIALPGAARDVEWRIQSATPLVHAPTLQIAWRHDRFVFLGEAGQRYQLVAGSASARRADYPVDVALAQLRSKLGADWQPPLATLGTRETLAGEAALKTPTPASKYDWKTFLLWGVLVAAAAAIGYLAMNLLRGQKSP
jgi:hypothetical protein